MPLRLLAFPLASDGRSARDRSSLPCPADADSASRGACRGSAPDARARCPDHQPGPSRTTAILSRFGRDAGALPGRAVRPSPYSRRWVASSGCSAAGFSGPCPTACRPSSTPPRPSVLLGFGTMGADGLCGLRPGRGHGAAGAHRPGLPSISLRRLRQTVQRA